MSHRLTLLLAGIWTLLGSAAQAHFLFLRILPPAEGGRAADVYFSDLPDTGDARFVNKIAQTELWLQKTPGRFDPLKVHKEDDRLRAWLPETGSLVVVGRCTYGVIARKGQKPFLLRHHPKALAGSPGDLNQMKPYGQFPLEILARLEPDGVRLVALKDGKPLPKAEFVTVDANLANTKLTADESGEATWKPASPGVYAVHTQVTRPVSGTFGDKKYEEVRDFATVGLTWPLQRKDADPKAVALFEEALAARAQWLDFPGFTAHITGNFDGRRFNGTVSVSAEGEVTFSEDDPSKTEAVSGWVEDQLGSLVMHRLPRSTRPGSTRPMLRFGDQRDDHPLGRLLVFEGGKFASSYRIQDKQIRVVNRHMGTENFTITTLENEQNTEGHFLPRCYVVQYWQAGTGRLLRTETIRDSWRRVGSWDLPASHLVTSASDTGLSVRTFTLSRQEMTSGKGK
jgi:hypothetical protein